jgi:hypothetical protein
LHLQHEDPSAVSDAPTLHPYGSKHSTSKSYRRLETSYPVLVVSTAEYLMVQWTERGGALSLHRLDVHIMTQSLSVQGLRERLGVYKFGVLALGSEPLALGTCQLDRRGVVPRDEFCAAVLDRSA